MNNQQKDSMQTTEEILQFVEDHDTFLITYYAKKHNEIITRRGTWRKPIEPNKNVNKWRRATNPTRCEVA